MRALAVNPAPLIALLLCQLACTTQLAVAPAADGASPRAAGPSAGPPRFGLGPDFQLDAVPGVPPLEEMEIALSGMDLELLQALKGARKTDRDASLAPAAKAAAWEALASRPGSADPGSDGTSNPFQQAAERRAALWRAVAEATARRAEQLEQLRVRFAVDRKAFDALVAAPEGHKQRPAAELAFETAYAPFESEITRWNLPPVGAAPAPEKVPAVKAVTPILDPTGIPVVRAQTVVVKGDFGAHAQSFSVDTSDDLMSAGGGQKPTFDVSGFYTGGHVTVNVAEQSELAIGLLAFGRYYVTTSLPENTFVSGSDPAGTLSPVDASATGAFAVGGGARLAGNVTERIGMHLGLIGGYQHFLPPESVPGCGPEEVAWDPTMRGFQGELFVGWEFYPIALLSFGVSGRVGFGHVQGEWCVPGTDIDPSSTTILDQPIDVSADSFSVGAQAEIGFHF